MYHTPGFGWRWPLKFRRIPTTNKGRACRLKFILVFFSLPLYRPQGSDDTRPHCRSRCSRGMSTYPHPNPLIRLTNARKAAHFGKPAQPYASDSLTWMRDTVLGKRVYCQMIRKDQYSRVVSLQPHISVHELILVVLKVSNVTLAPRILPGFFFTGKNVSIEMLKAGWGTVYEQAGAEYGISTKEKMQTIEAAARYGTCVTMIPMLSC